MFKKPSPPLHIVQSKYCKKIDILLILCKILLSRDQEEASSA